MALGGNLAGMARVVLRADTDGYTRDMQQAERTFRRTTDDMNRHVSSLSRGALAGTGIFHGFARSIAFASGAFLGGAGLTFAIKSSITAASDLNEQINKASVVFRGSQADILAWSKTTATSLGISQREALATASTFGNMLIPMGFARDRSERLSKSLVELAADLASFNNANPQDVLEAMRSGLAGEIEPLRRYGVFLTQARIQQELLNAGVKVTPQTITAAQKAWATYRIIIKDTADAQGDFGRTSEGLANQQRILKAQIGDLQAALGKQLLPTVLHLVSSLNRWLESTENQQRLQRDFAATLRATAKAIDGIVASVRGILRAYKWLDDFVTGLHEWGQSVDAEAKKIGVQLALNIIEPFSHLPSRFGKWAKDIKKELQNELGSSPKAGSPEFTQSPGSAGQVGIAIANKAVEIGADKSRVYVWGGASAQVGYDCSGFVYDMYKRQGITIPRTSDTQFYDPNALNIALEDLEAGDAVYFIGSNSGANAGRPPRHCGIYIGSGNFIEYFSRGKPAKIAPLRSRGDYMGARRWLKVVASTGGGGSAAPVTTDRGAGPPPPSGPSTAKPKKKKATAVGISAAARAAEGEATLPGLAGVLTLYENLTRGLHTQAVKGIPGGILVPFKPHIADWQRIRGKLIEKLKAAIKRRQAVARSLARARRARHKDKALIQNHADALAALDRTIRTIRLDIADATAAIQDLRRAATDTTGGEAEDVPADTVEDLDPTQLPVDIEEAGILAEGTGGVEDDLGALRQQEAFFVGQLAATTAISRYGVNEDTGRRELFTAQAPLLTNEQRLDVERSLNAVRDRMAAIAAAQAQAAEEARRAAEEATKAADDAAARAAADYEAGLLNLPASLRLGLARARGTTDTADDAPWLQQMRDLLAGRIAMTSNLETQVSLQNEINDLDSQIRGLMEQRVDGVDAQLEEQKRIDAQTYAYLAGQRELVRTYGSNIIGRALGGSPITIANYWNNTNVDPHLWTKQTEFELRALVS